MELRHCTVAEIAAAPNLDALLAAYAAESTIPELGPPKPQLDVYRKLEAQRVIYPIAAFDGANCVGFISVVATVLPHYGAFAAQIESFFVMREHRRQGIGLRLLRMGIDKAWEVGAKGLLISAPVGSALDKVLAKNKHARHNNNLYVIGFS